MILRLDKNKILHLINQNILYAGENTDEMIQVYINPVLCDKESTKCDFNLFYKNKSIEGYTPLFLSEKRKDSFFIVESIFDSKMTSVSGLIELWLEIKTPKSKYVSSPIKVQIKPGRKEKVNRTISIESDIQEDRLIALENRCKTYFQMAKKESEKAKKCVQMMIDLIAEQGKRGFR